MPDGLLPGPLMITVQRKQTGSRPGGACPPPHVQGEAGKKKYRLSQEVDVKEGESQGRWGGAGRLPGAAFFPGTWLAVISLELCAAL